MNTRIADAVKAAGIDKFVYIGVASELSGGPIKFIFGDYVKGKAEAVASVKKDFGASALIIQPGISIHAGPHTRGPSHTLCSSLIAWRSSLRSQPCSMLHACHMLSALTRALFSSPSVWEVAGAPPGELRPPGPPGMTPVPVAAVAKAAVAGALGKTSGTIDGNDAIAAAAGAM